MDVEYDETVELAPPPLVTTTIEDLNDLVREPYCHTFPYGSATAYCGLPRDEQEFHGLRPTTGQRFCSICGRELCPACNPERA